MNNVPPEAVAAVSGLYRRAAWPLLARLDPEDAHNLALRLLSVAERVPGALALLERLCAVRDDRLAVDVLGLRFPNQVGLAAGLDKHATAPRAFAALGFGAVELGTVTPRAQPGNPRPRIFRLTEHGALINRMGFPSHGASAVRARLAGVAQRMPGGAVLGVNLGKNATTPLEEAAQDYVTVLDALHDRAHYAVVNVSSPNTKGLRDLQERRALEDLLRRVVVRRDGLARAGRRLPLLVKVAPDLDEAGLSAAVEAALAAGVDGMVATNTTLSRDGVSGTHAAETGGLSGAPLRSRATDVVRFLARELAGRLPIVGAGGIASPEDALEKLDAGAALVQLYTGFIYAGPTLPARINAALLTRLRTP
jgi:dihydroorotate dehydrogenase